MGTRPEGLGWGIQPRLWLLSPAACVGAIGWAEGGRGRAVSWALPAVSAHRGSGAGGEEVGEHIPSTMPLQFTSPVSVDEPSAWAPAHRTVVSEHGRVL